MIRSGKRLNSEPSHCRDCGSEVVHEQGIKLDYIVYCTNPNCPNHQGVDVGDMECPEWSTCMKRDDSSILAQVPKLSELELAVALDACRRAGAVWAADALSKHITRMGIENAQLAAKIQEMELADFDLREAHDAQAASGG
jgi:hypothetical protein